MKLEWEVDDDGDHFAEVASLLCIVYTWNSASCGDIWAEYNGIDDVCLYTTKQNLSADEMKLHLEEKLIEILKVWHDAYEELVK